MSEPQTSDQEVPVPDVDSLGLDELSDVTGGASVNVNTNVLGKFGR